MVPGPVEVEVGVEVGVEVEVEVGVEVGVGVGVGVGVEVVLRLRVARGDAPLRTNGWGARNASVGKSPPAAVSTRTLAPSAARACAA